MLQTEYIRSLHSNYERIALEQNPQEHRYQYCMLSRGGIKGLLSCDLRYVNGSAYLYYDITSKQNIALLYQKDVINREWFLDFMWSVKYLRDELGRFLLLENNVLWDPEQIFQDLERNVFAFLYVPYYEGENHFINLMGFFVEHVDYSDEKLVELVYHLYEQCEKNGQVYLQERIFEDVKEFEEKMLEKSKEPVFEKMVSVSMPVESITEEKNTGNINSERKTFEKKITEKRGLLSWFEKNKEKEELNRVKEQQWEETGCLCGVAEEAYSEEYGQTVFLDAPKESGRVVHKVYSEDGKILVAVDREVLLIGKNKDKVDIYLEDLSVSRLHGRILMDKENKIYLEDLNSTNGTFLNGTRLQPYERRGLEPGDEIMCGKIMLQYR